MSKISSFPNSVKKLCSLGAWIVGSACNSEEPRDIDLMIPWKLWPNAALQIPPYASPTSLGGWRWKENDVVIEVWPDTLDRLAEFVGFFSEAWHPLTGQRIRVVRDRESLKLLEQKD